MTTTQSAQTKNRIDADQAKQLLSLVEYLTEWEQYFWYCKMTVSSSICLSLIASVLTYLDLRDAERVFSSGSSRGE